MVCLLFALAVVDRLNFWRLNLRRRMTRLAPAVEALVASTKWISQGQIRQNDRSHD